MGTAPRGPWSRSMAAQGSVEFHACSDVHEPLGSTPQHGSGEHCRRQAGGQLSAAELRSGPGTLERSEHLRFIAALG